MKLYKLTDKNNISGHGYVETEWEIGETVQITEHGTHKTRLCSKDVLHAYKNLNLGLLLNPIHANIQDFNIFECEGDVVVEDYGKIGVLCLTPTKKKTIPKWYKDEKIRKKVAVLFSIYCAEEVLHYFEIVCPDDRRPRNAIKAAKEYLNNSKNSAADNAAYAAYAADAAHAAYDAADAAAYATAYAAHAAADAAAYATAYDAAHAAYDAARAAAYAADAAARTTAYATARAAAYAADAAADAAAAHAAYDAARAAHTSARNKINFSKLADKAIKEIMNAHNY